MRNDCSRIWVTQHAVLPCLLKVAVRRTGTHAPEVEVNEEVGRVRRRQKYGCHAMNVGREVRPCAANSNDGLDLLKPIAARVCL